MPYINVKVAGPQVDEQQVTALQHGTTALIVEALNKKASLAAVVVETVPLANWSIGAAAVPCAAHVDVMVGEGTNTAEQKAQLSSRTHALLQQVLGSELPLATYVVIHGLARDTWGYSGLTQEHRIKVQA